MISTIVDSKEAVSICRLPRKEQSLKSWKMHAFLSVVNGTIFCDCMASDRAKPSGGSRLNN